MAARYGQLGDGNGTFSRVPVDVAGLGSGVAEIASGYRHTCARTNAGAVKCWGFNQFGQLGNGTVNVVALSPVDVTGLASGATAIGAGYQHACAATAGGVKCWGWNSGGQLGNGSQTDSAVPVDVVGLGGVARLALGQFHSCARTVAGAAFCWGSDLFGALGDGGANQSASTPVAVAGLPSGVVELAAGDSTTCARLSDGSVRCWGEHTEGQVGMGQDTRSTVPVNVPGALATQMDTLAGGGGHTCSVIQWGVKCWGQNGSGQVGMSTTTTLVTTPVSVAGLPASMASVVTGAGHSCAVGDVGSGGTLWCWGENAFGQLGNGTNDGGPTPLPVSGLVGAGVASVGAGQFHTCAHVGAGAKCWGGGADGKLGRGSTASSNVPVDVSGLASDVRGVTVGANHSCALTYSDTVKCWGRNADGELGNGGSTASWVPVDVVGLPSGIAMVASGYFHTCALQAAGTVYCWGYNGYGALGDGTTTSSRVPKQVTGLGAAAYAIAAGEYHTCALVSDGTPTGGVKCWGMNLDGQLGDGTTSQYRLTPVSVVALPAVTPMHLTAGARHTCMRDLSGAVYCWGSNLFGQLGNGGANSFPSPVGVVVDGRCATFTDVDAASPFCPSVQWLRNRKVTLGCVAGQYCPAASVSRLAMSAFMNRLGTALGAEFVTQQEFSGAFDPGTVPRLCTTSVVPELTVSRRAEVDAIINATASADVGLGLAIVASVDGGNTWKVVSEPVQLAVVRANGWSVLRASASLDLEPGRTARFALAVGTGGLPAGGTIDDSTCNLRVRLDNRNGASVPY